MKRIIFYSLIAILLNNLNAAAATIGYILPVKFYYDVNSNCLKDGTEPYAIVPELIRVDSNGVPVDTISATSGFYYFAFCPVGTIYQFSVLNTTGGPVVICPSSGSISDTIAATTFIYPDKYFGLGCPATSTFDLAEHAIIPITGAFDQWGYLFAGNNSCSAVGATLAFTFSPKYVYVGEANPHPTTVSGNTLTWDISKLIADGTFDHIDYMLRYNPASGPLKIGDTVQAHVTITPISGDSNPINNSETKVDTVKASHDPNEISVSPATCIAPGASPIELKYMIRFENTGNDIAHNIYVMDTLSEYLDPGTLRIEMATHPMMIESYMNEDMSTGRKKGIVKFDFPEINLLDSSHHDKCNGAVIYTIKTKPGLTTGIHINNYAGIYFDHNDVVMTNMAENAIGCVTKTEVLTTDTKVQTYPNPANTFLMITARDNVHTIAITNLLGKTVYSKQCDLAQVKVDVAGLPTGVYFVRINGTETRKFVKE